MALTVAGVSIFMLVRGFIVQQQKQAVAKHALFITEVVLANELVPSDFSRPTARRLAELDRLFRRKVLLGDVVGVALYSKSGRVSYAPTRRLLGARTADTPSVLRALRGSPTPSFVGTAPIAGKPHRVLGEAVPVRFASGGAAGAVVLLTDYATIADAAGESLVPIAIVLPVVLLLLLAGLVPVLRRATRQIRTDLDEREFEAMHDALTGLPTRTLFEDRVGLALARSRRSGRATAVMLLDLNRFKEVNDTLGHAAGDAMLREVASRIASTLRGVDTVARLGGDEFTVVLGDVEVGDAHETATRIHHVLEAPIAIEGLSLSVGASIGIALYPAHGETVSALLQHADVAMYQSKRGGTPYEIYDPATDTNDAERLSLASDLRTAVESGQLTLHYQPKLDLRSGSIDGVEALVRWQHPSLGLLDADRFLPLAEQIGLATRISEWGLDEAIRQCGAWCADGIELDVAVNLDVRSLVDLDLPDRVRALLERHDVDAERIELEITEGTIMSDPVRVRRVAVELAALGVRLALDDFGTGYSSLSYLARLPISKLKIDRSFVGRMGASERERIIVGATVELAHNLGLAVVAEGVEDPATLELVRELGADSAQGYFIGQPAAADAFVGANVAWQVA